MRCTITLPFFSASPSCTVAIGNHLPLADQKLLCIELHHAVIIACYSVSLETNRS